MNTLEYKIVDGLIDLKYNYGCVGVKAEFEAEGTRLDEALRLKEIVSLAGMGLTIKIGGCEAIKDIYDAINIGVERIVAPMVETPYALEKYLRIVEKCKGSGVCFFVNIETKTAFESLGLMLDNDKIGLLSGVVVGRSDMSGSLGLKPTDVDCEQIFDIVNTTLSMCKRRGLQTVMGGGVSIRTVKAFIPALKGRLDRYETRKIIFDCQKAESPEEGIRKALAVELLWLENKKNYYTRIAAEDDLRLEVLRSRGV